MLLVSCPGLARSQVSEGDQWLRNPVDDATFSGFLQFFDYDREMPFEPVVGTTITEEGISRQHLEYSSTPGERVTAWTYQAATGPDAPWAIFLHGGSGGGKDAPGYRFLSSFFARAGWNVLAIDLQYFGERSTDLITTFTEEEKHERLYNRQAIYLDWVAQSVKDVGRGIDYLTGERGADPERIVLVGFSRGAQFAYIVGAVEKRLRAVVALYGGHFDRLETGHHPAACGANYIGRISPRPLLLVNGTEDRDFVKEVSVDPMHALAREPVDVIWVETGHTLPPEETLSQVVRWMADKVL
jgi:dipeptidyl aminopeptidase/acylaminoacyl peptidase